MEQYKVTIKVTKTYTYETDDAVSAEDAIAEAFGYSTLWECAYGCTEYAASAKVVTDG